MIYICGTELELGDLPLSSALNYSLVVGRPKIAATLMMGIRKSNVIKCYVNTEFKDLKVSLESADKVVYFDTDEALLALLSGDSQDNDAKEPEVEEIPSVLETRDSDEEIREIEDRLTSDNDDNQLILKSVEDVGDFEEVEGVLETTISEGGLFEADLLKTQLATTEAILEQNRAVLLDTNRELHSVYDYAVDQIAEQTLLYEAKLKEAQDAFDSLQEQLANTSVGGPLDIYTPYADKSRAIIKTGIALESKPHNMCVVSAGSSDSVATLYQSLALLALGGRFKGVILDFTGDPVFGISVTNLAHKKLQTGIRNKGETRKLTPDERKAINLKGSPDLVDYIRGDTDLLSVLQSPLGLARIGTSGFFHDISLLTVDWVAKITEIREVLGDSQVVLVIPPVTTFVGRYLAASWSSVIPVNIATVCAPSAIYSTQNNLNAFPPETVRILALNYIKLETSDSVLSGIMNKKYAVKPFRANTIFSLPEPTVKDWEGNINNNEGIWKTAFSVG